MLSHIFTEPYGYSDVPQFRIVKMYTHAFLTKMKILCSFIVSASSRLRLVIATTAFGMKTDCPDNEKSLTMEPPVILNSMYKKQEEQDVMEGGKRLTADKRLCFKTIYVTMTTVPLFVFVVVCALAFMFVW